MKRFAFFICLILCALSTMANEYTDKLTVTVNGESMEQQATITVIQNEDGKYTFSLNNFCLESVEPDGTVTRIGVGNIVLPDIEGTTVDGITTITYNDGINIAAGDDPDIDFWMGPTLAVFGPVPIELVARFNETQLYCEIHINLEALQQVIVVVFGTEPISAVKEIPMDSAASSQSAATPIFDMQGRQVRTLKSHSLYIIDGKKRIIR